MPSLFLTPLAVPPRFPFVLYIQLLSILIEAVDIAASGATDATQSSLERTASLTHIASFPRIVLNVLLRRVTPPTAQQKAGIVEVSFGLALSLSLSLALCVAPPLTLSLTHPFQNRREPSRSSR